VDFDQDGFVFGAARRLRDRISVMVRRSGCGAMATLEAAGMDYLLGVRERTLREAEMVVEDDGAMIPLVMPRAKGRETQLEAKAVEIDGRRHIVCRNEERAAEGAAARAAILDSRRPGGGGDAAEAGRRAQRGGGAGAAGRAGGGVISGGDVPAERIFRARFSRSAGYHGAEPPHG
jgi:hypothetical protein